MPKKLTITITLLILATLTFAQTTNRGIVAETIAERENTLGKPEIKFQTGHTSGVHSVSFSPDGKYIASGSQDNTVKVWDVDSGKVIREFTHYYGIFTVSFSPCGKYIVGGSIDAIILWEVESGKEIKNIFSAHEYWVNSVSFSPDGKYLVSSGEYDSTVKLWDIENGKVINSFTGHSAGVQTVSLSPDGKYIASASRDNTVKLWEVESGKEIRTLTGHKNWVKSVSFSPDGKYIASGSNDSTVKLWDIESGKEIDSFTGYSASFSPDGKYIASASGDSTIKLWEVESGKEIRAFSSHSSQIYFVSFSPDGKYIVSGSDDGTVKVWDVEKGKEIWAFYLRTDTIAFVSFSPDGKYLVSTGGIYKDVTVKVWNLENGKEIWTSFHIHRPFVTFSPDSKSLLIESDDNTIKLWEVESGKEVKTFSGHTDNVASVSFSPDGKYLASGSDDKTVKLWEVDSGKKIRTFSGHTYDVKSVSFSPDSKYIASGSADGTVKLWDVETGELIYTIINGKDGEWLTYTPEGFFTGSEWATKNLVHIVDGLEVIGIDQVYDKLYRPDLVAAKMRGEDISMYAKEVNLASLVRSGSVPVVTLANLPENPTSRDITFDVCVKNTGGGIGKVNLVLNGKTIQLSEGVSSSTGQTVNFRHTITLQNGENTIEAFAYNGSGMVESRRTSNAIKWEGATSKPNLYVLTLAINKYRDKSLWLNYCVPDANAIATSFKTQEAGLYENVYVSSLQDGEVTKEGIREEFERLSNLVTADDVFVFYISGHGTTYDDGDYYYLPVNFRYTSKEEIPIQGISKNDLIENLSLIKAGKTLLMLDTCNSGAFFADSGQRGLSEKTAIDRLTRATGHATLAASSDSQSAMEGYEGHGVFTYVLLEGLKGEADSNDDGFVTLLELASYVENEVPERSYEKWGYEQVPQKDLRRQDFPIAGGL